MTGTRDVTSGAGRAAGPDPGPGAAAVVPRWLPVTAVALVVAGLAASGYLTYEHFTASKTLACPDTGTVSCARVTSSEQSVFLGVPVAPLGLGYFVGMLVLVLPAAWRSPDARLRYARIAAAALGVCFVLYLVYAELFLIGAICLWCTVVHVVTVALFAVVVLGAAMADPDAGPPR